MGIFKHKLNLKVPIVFVIFLVLGIYLGFSEIHLNITQSPRVSFSYGISIDFTALYDIFMAKINSIIGG